MTVNLNLRTDIATANDPQFDQIVERIGQLVEAGRMDAAAQLIDEHPEHGDALRRLLPALEALASLDGSLPASSSPESASSPAAVLGVLGDYRIVREIGRGGMGVVYEAQQISLNRRVALKVLPMAAMLDGRRLERFRHEAQAAAMLRHPHLVTVYAVGCERGIHYYAMDYIEGPSLAEVAEKLRAGDCPDFAESAEQNGTVPLSKSADTQPVAVLSTLRSTQPAAFFRSVAGLGVQAAEALDYAHQLGVVHRDIKPSNLLIDAQSHLWIADFGLAMTQNDAGLTMTGDILGTLRYMSPEQAAGKRLPLDHRTDVYSLGVTLYELVASRPAFDATDRAELLRAIAEVDPPSLRHLVPTIPADLATIVHKAIEKDAADRYATARELADDLANFLDDRPIVARPPSALQRVRKWTRRHAAMVAAAVVVLALAVVGLAVSAVMLNQAHQEALAEKTQAEQNLQIAVDAIDRLLIQFAEDAHHHGQLHHAEIMLGDAVTAYERVLAGGKDPAILIKAAGAHSALSGVFQAAGQTDRALEQADSGLQLLGGLASDDARSVRADLLMARSAALLDKQQFDAAQSSLQETVAIRERLAAAPDAAEIDNERQGDLLLSLKAQAELKMKTGGLAATELLLKRCVAIVESRPQGLQDGPWWADQRSDLYQFSGAIASERDDDPAAVDAFSSAVERQQTAVECLPDSERFRNDLYACRRDLADALVHAGRLDEAAAEIATFVGEFPGRLQAYIDGFDLLLDCADQADADAAATYIQQAGELIQRAPSAKFLPADERRALAWRLATCPHRELRDGPRAEKIASYLCFRAFMDPKNQEVLAAADFAIANYKGAAISAGLAIGFARDGGSGAQLVLLALGRAREGEIDVAEKVWAKAVAWREANPPLDDRGLKALFDEAEQQFAAVGSTPSTPRAAEAQR